MRPKIAIFTTPNKEYNVLFENFEGPFRHYDHKFEWTREEFNHWVQTCIIDKYPEYQVERFDGVGEGPPNIGHCSQIVVLIRRDFDEAARNGEFDNITIQDDDQNALNRNFIQEDEASDDFKYKIVASYDYPMQRETRSRKQIISDEAHFKLYHIAEISEEWENQEPAVIEIHDLMDYDKLQQQNVDVDELCDIIGEIGFEVYAGPEGSLRTTVPYPEYSDDEEGKSFHMMQALYYKTSLILNFMTSSTS